MRCLCQAWALLLGMYGDMHVLAAQGKETLHSQGLDFAWRRSCGIHGLDSEEFKAPQRNG
jgi:hypothetical protein